MLFFLLQFPSLYKFYNTRKCSIFPSTYFPHFSIKAIEHIHKKGQICILDINTDAVQSMKKTEYHKATVYIYIRPPSKAELVSISKTCI